MIIDLERRPQTTGMSLPEWAAAEVLDTPLADDSLLRAVICRLAAGKWQWSILSIEAERGALISSGVEKSIAAARQAATCEIAKCIEDPLV